MFEHLTQYRIVLVTGPQRSGTTIAAKMIAADTGLAFVDENDFGVKDIAPWGDMVTTARKRVIQCPSMCRFVHWFGGYDDVAVVLMRRDVEDIIRSERRIGWSLEAFELSRYAAVDGPISAVKYGYWDNYQKTFIKHAFEVGYRSLADHPLWLPDDARKNFTAKQTELMP